MKILVANPNSSEDVTNSIMKTAKGSNINKGTELIALTNPKGTKAIDCTFSDYQSAWSFHREILKQVEVEKPDAVVVAGFGNLGIFALKEVLSIPALSISEISMSVASTLGHKFNILTTLKQFIPAQEDIVRMFGMESKCSCVRAIDVSVEDCVSNREKTLNLLESEVLDIMENTQAEVIILGSGGLSGYNKELENRVNIPVLDPVQTTVKFAEMMVGLGISHSKKQKFAYPPQEISNYFK